MEAFGLTLLCVLAVVVVEISAMKRLPFSGPCFLSLSR